MAENMQPTGLIPINSRVFRTSSILNSLSNVDLNLQSFDQNLQDPTYLGFRIEFGNWGSSLTKNYNTDLHYKKIEDSDYDTFPCGLKFSTDYETTSGNQIKYYDARTWLYNRGEDLRVKYLDAFIKGMLELTSQMPFVFTSISGIQDLIKVDSTKGQRLNKDAKINIKCNESVDLKITTLKQLYKKAAWDDVYQRWILPDIMRSFKMIIYISDFRWFHNGGKFMSNINDDLPLIVLECSPCEFIINEGELPSEIKNNVPDIFNDVSFSINVKNLNVWNSNKTIKTLAELLGEPLIGEPVVGSEVKDGFSNFAYRQYIVRKFFLTELNGSDDTVNLVNSSDNTLGPDKKLDSKNVFDESILKDASENHSLDSFKAKAKLDSSYALITSAYDEYRSGLDYLGPKQFAALAQQDLIRKRSERRGGLKDGFFYEPIEGTYVDYRLHKDGLEKNSSISLSDKIKKTPLYGIYASLDDITAGLTTLIDYINNPSGSYLTDNIINASLMDENTSTNQRMLNIDLDSDFNYSLLDVSISGENIDASLHNNGFPVETKINTRLKRPLLENTKSLLSSVLNQNTSIYFDNSGLMGEKIVNFELEDNSSTSLENTQINNDNLYNVVVDASFNQDNLNQNIKKPTLDLDASSNYMLIPVELEEALYEAKINDVDSLLNTIKLNIDLLNPNIENASLGSSKMMMKQFALEKAFNKLEKIIDLKLEEAGYFENKIKDVSIDNDEPSSKLKSELKDVKIEEAQPRIIELKNVELEDSSNRFSSIKNIELEKTSPSSNLSELKPINLEDRKEGELDKIKDVDLSNADVEKNAFAELKSINIDSKSGTSIDEQKIREVQINDSNENNIENQKLKDVKIEEAQPRKIELKDVILEDSTREFSDVKMLELEKSTPSSNLSELKPVILEEKEKDGLNSQKLKDVELEEKTYKPKLKNVKLEESRSGEKLKGKL